MILEYTLSTAAVARGFSGYLATLLGHQPDAFMLPLWFLRLDPLALVLVAILCGLLCYGTSESSYINNGAALPVPVHCHNCPCRRRCGDWLACIP